MLCVVKENFHDDVGDDEKWWTFSVKLTSRLTDDFVHNEHFNSMGISEKLTLQGADASIELTKDIHC